jgi:predicted metal-dependent hydrolase
MSGGKRELRLFGPEEMRAIPAWQARMKALAARPSPRPTAREARQRENVEAMDKLLRIAEELAPSFGLGYAAIEPERDGETRHYGICYADGLIRIRLRHAVSDRLLKESSLVDTLCHELAHLRHMNHGERFRKLYGRILDEARGRGFYRPGPNERPRAAQLALFSERDCGMPRR